MKLKLCGIRRAEDISYVNAFPPDYIGFVFAKSKRQVSAEQAAALSKGLRAGIQTVGVFVNEPIEHLLQIAERARLDVLQLHGDEDAAYIETLRQRTKRPIWKAVRVTDAESIRRSEQLPVDLLLLDSFSPTAYGGSGKVANWPAIREANPQKPFFLAGGLTAENLFEAVEAVHPAGVDLSGGIETGGCKDREKIRAVVTQFQALQDAQGIKQEGRKDNMSKIGRYGEYGGQYVPETVMNAVHELEAAYATYKDDPDFQKELSWYYQNYAGRPSMLYYAEKMTKDLGGAKIYIKREDLNHTGSHKINNVLGQILLAKRMGKKRIIAETGAGQHGVATATAAALFGMECEVYMGATDVERQSLNVYRMELLGAKVIPVHSGTATLKDAINEAMRDWTTNVETTHYLIGSVMGPHPYPQMVRDFQKIIGQEAKRQLMEIEGRLPDAVCACVGGGSNAMGMFYDFIPDESVRLLGAEAAGEGVDTDRTAATISRGRAGIFHGMKSIFLQNEEGQIAPVYSLSAGLDYPGIGPEHAQLAKTGRGEYFAITDEEAVCAFEYLSRMEGIIPAIESAHAVALACKIAPTMRKDQTMIICLSGRGDKDVYQVARYRGVKLNEQD